MKEAIVQPDLNVEVVDSEIPVPNDDEVVIKVMVSGSNPKDWKLPVMFKKAMNSGDDIAGVVHEIGRNVYEFKPGDRVASFHQMMSKGGSFAEYAVSWAHTTFHIPNKTSFEEAASIPLAAMTAAMGLYQRLEGLPLPWHPTTKPTPLIVYGAATAVGAYAIKLARLSNIHPLICVAGRGIQFVETIIDKDKGDVILDYRDGNDKLVANMKTEIEKAGGKVEYAFDAVSEHGSYDTICKVLDHEAGQITLVLPGNDYSAIPSSIKRTDTMVGAVHPDMDLNQLQTEAGGETYHADFGYVMFRFFSRGLSEGWFRGHPQEVVPGGLAGISSALKNLKDGKASAVNGEKKDFEVYSCHVSPDGSRLVTAAGDGYVRVWSTEAVFRVADPNYDGPKQLASMSYHSGTIHTVRFSGNGRYLASGADDKIVCVYTLDPHPPSHNATFGTDEPPPVETWKIHRRLIGHDNDVQDLGWSYDSSILVSVGLDSKVVVWSGYTFEKLKSMSGHQSLVKGIAFDPANKYFATASDDRTVKLWRFTPPGPNSTSYDQLSNFTLEKTITAPFVSSPLTTYFRRCSWSPDGNHIAAANAVNGPVSSVAIINRGSWDGDIHLIGHEGPVEVCAFSPRLFSKIRPTDQPLDSKGQHISNLVTVIACAGQDKALTVWITSNSRPLVITQDLALKSLSDLAWTPDGTSLFITSLDGGIMCVMFEPGELGYEVSLEETEKTLERFGAGRRGAGIIEGTDALLLEERSREGELRDAEGRMGALMGDAPPSQNSNINGNSTPAPPSTSAANGVTPAHDVGSNLVNGDAQPGPDGDKSDKAQAPEDPNKEKLEKLKSRVTITKDGKKRIAPLLLSSSGGHQSSLPRAQLMSTSKNGQGVRSDAPQTVLELSKPFDGLPKGGLASLLLGNKRKWAQIEGAEECQIEKRIALTRSEGAVPILTNTTDGLVPAKTGSGMAGQQPTPEYIRPAIVNPSLTISQVRLAVPRIRRHIVQTYGEASGLPVAIGDSDGPNDAHPSSNRQAHSDVMIEARNPSQLPTTGKAPDQEPCRVTVSRRGLPLWQDFLPRSTLLVTGNKVFWAVGCEDGSIHAWTSAGRRLVNALILESQPVILECKNNWLLCVTAAGMCYVWDMKTLGSPHPPVSLAPVLDIAIYSLQDHVTLGPAVTSAHLNAEGRIVVTLSNGDGFAYSPSMYVWQRLTELWWAVGSQYWNTTDSSLGDIRSAAGSKNASNVSAGIIPFLERGTTSESMVRGKSVLLQRLVKQLLSREGYEGFESCVSVAHLENRMAGAMMLGSKEEFQVYLYMYAKRLGAEGLKSKVEELLRGLLGGVSEEDEGEAATEKLAQRNAEDRNWDNTTEVLCGWSRKELLRGVILILGKNRDLQRITVPYANVLGVTSEQDTDGDSMVS
ncbi:MAG: hypothetical protein Q9186_002875 [Xanthomendoza sp. 1 TL-2023]